MPKVRVTIHDRELDVSDAEMEVLRRQGLLVEEAPPAPPPAKQAGTKNEENL